MKEIFNRLAAFNLWANQSIIDALATLPTGDWQKPLGGSFPTVFDTLLHTWNAESIWWQRMKLQETIQPPVAGDHTAGGVMDGLLEQSAKWNEWVQRATEAALRHEFIYRNMKGETFKNPVYEVLTHVFNHSTYHRGQLVNYLRQLECKVIPSTDFIVFTRKK